jgi:hypothetical protein
MCSTELANDGTIGKAVQGLAATITGLGAVIAPVIELFLRMGAALGDSVGVALQGVGSGIQQVIPFFEKLAEVAGTILVDAFNQLGPPIARAGQLHPARSGRGPGRVRLDHAQRGTARHRRVHQLPAHRRHPRDRRVHQGRASSSSWSSPPRSSSMVSASWPS